MNIAGFRNLLWEPWQKGKSNTRRCLWQQNSKRSMRELLKFIKRDRISHQHSTHLDGRSLERRTAATWTGKAEGSLAAECASASPPVNEKKMTKTRQICWA